MDDALSNDDTAKIFKCYIRVHNIKSLNLPLYGNSRECPVWICSNVMAVVVLVSHSAAARCHANNAENAVILAMCSTTDITILPLITSRISK